MNSFTNIAFIYKSVKKYQKHIAIALIFAFLNLVIGCNYYRVNRVATTPQTIHENSSDLKYVVLHLNHKAWHLTNVSIVDSSMLMYGVLEELPENHQYYREAQEGKPNRYKPSQGEASYEAHFFVSQVEITQNVLVKISFKDINRIDVYDKDIGATTASYVFGTVGVVAGVLAVIAIVVVLTKSSCPFIYTHNGTNFQFYGELYGGAIYPSLERHDYLYLNGVSPQGGIYTFQITNELLEKQYTNLAELIVVDHPQNTQVLMDKYGSVQTISQAQVPFSAKANGKEYASVLSQIDSNNFLFSEPSKENKDMSHVDLSFKNPMHAKQAKLLIHAKNSLWLDYAYGEFNKQFGTYYSTFVEKQKKVSKAKNIQWALEQGIPLQVQIQTKKGMITKDYFEVMGPLAARDVVLPLDIAACTDDILSIRLFCGTLFWELDYVAIDFSEPSAVEVSYLKPTTAKDETGQDIRAQLLENDANYLVQPKVGNKATLSYTALATKPGLTRSVFMHSKGYYEYIRNFTNEPNYTQLISFKQKGGFAKFSNQRLAEWQHKANLFSLALSQNQ